MFQPRPKQQEVLAYSGGKMGVSAVPGSGKTLTLSHLAAQIILANRLDDDQEVLIVTLVNSAVDNFARRIGGIIKAGGRLPYLGYRVRTLHGLAHEIVRERPALLGLDDKFGIVDERLAEELRNDAARAWLTGHPNALDDTLDRELQPAKADWVRRDHLPRLVQSVAQSAIRYAKDRLLTPDQLREQVEAFPGPLPLARMASAIYADYQRSLAYRSAVDFDDLIRLALTALKLDDALLERLQERWPYILEDEAQDSSRLQEQILRLLVGENGNWVRVGDPNQAIYETFTTAKPRFLLDFLDEPAVLRRELPNSGRSSQSIITLANYLIDWTRREHPNQQVRNALTLPHILPSGPDDTQPNPPDNPASVQLIERKFSPRGELLAVVDSLARWLPEHPDSTVAVLTPRNQRGFELVDELKRRKIEVVDSLLRSASATRSAAGSLGNILNYLADPTSPSKLATLFRVWRRTDREDEEAHKIVEEIDRLLKRCRQVEDYLWPAPLNDWLAEQTLDDVQRDLLLEFRSLVQRWQGTILLPIDQAILTIAPDLFDEPADLALTHKLAGLLSQASREHPHWQLPDLAAELAVIAQNQRRFLGFADDDIGFDPERYKGKVVVSTMHKAKGLEWDRVYLMAANDYNFPSGQRYDSYISERWFIRDSLNLEAESLAELELAAGDALSLLHQEGQASEQARLEYVRERLRLLYVGITRAKTDLIITWNDGRKGEAKPALPFVALQAFWKERQHGAA